MKYLIIVCMFFLVSCGGSSSSTPLISENPNNNGAGDEASPSVEASRVTIAASDGLTLVGTLQPGKGEGAHPAVLLLPVFGRHRDTWQAFAGRLADAGLTSLALDLRGQGDTGGAQDWQQASDDVLKAWAFLMNQEGVDKTRTAIVGASIGANLALKAAAAEPRVNTVVLLSAGLDYFNVTTDDAIVRYGRRPALIVASEEDTFAANSSRELARLAGSPVSRLLLLNGAGHGTAMLARNTNLSGQIIDWLVQNTRGVSANIANVLEVSATGTEGAYSFSVKISSPDTGCDQYADWWEILSNSGELLYRRVLLHSHVDEQPFTRSGGPVNVPASQTLWVRAHSSAGGYGGAVYTGSVRDGFQPSGLPPDFADKVSSQLPLPESCAF
ncbi:MAG TPA: alpha/beta fold hydrolase [Gammaproteobacteria bacterium]|nr:alpha/beta fold hydrolase [Gammaproteobacteria bacterium]